jgi:hypothetical protein
MRAVVSDAIKARTQISGTTGSDHFYAVRADVVYGEGLGEGEREFLCRRVRKPPP